MSEQTMSQDGYSVCDNQYQRPAHINCSQGSQPEIAGYKFQLLAEDTLELSGSGKQELVEGGLRARLLDLFAILRDILSANRSEGYQLNQNSSSSSPMLVHTSNGCSVQPVLWNPGAFYREKGR